MTKPRRGRVDKQLEHRSAKVKARKADSYRRGSEKGASMGGAARRIAPPITLPEAPWERRERER